MEHIWKRFRADRGRRLLRDHVERVGARFTPIPAAAVLEAVVFPSAGTIADAVRRTVGFGRG